MVGVSAWAALSGAASAAGDLALAFGARESVEQISLSPDGTRIAYLAPLPGQGSALYTVNLSNGQAQVAATVDGSPQRLDRCLWVSNTRLTCRIYAVVKGDELLPVTRMVALDADGKNVKVLTQSDTVDQRYSNLYGGAIVDLLPDQDGVVLMDRWFVPEVEQKTRLNNQQEGYGVVRVDTRSLATKLVEDPIRYGVEYLSDGEGAFASREFSCRPVPAAMPERKSATPTVSKDRTVGIRWATMMSWAAPGLIRMRSIPSSTPFMR